MSGATEHRRAPTAERSSTGRGASSAPRVEADERSIHRRENIGAVEPAHTRDRSHACGSRVVPCTRRTGSRRTAAQVRGVIACALRRAAWRSQTRSTNETETGRALHATFLAIAVHECATPRAGSAELFTPRSADSHAWNHRRSHGVCRRVAEFPFETCQCVTRSALHQLCLTWSAVVLDNTSMKLNVRVMCQNS
jgi:hypothetical protein